MSEADIINKLAAAIAAHLRTTIPVSIDLWDIATIAQYLKRNEATVRERMACLPDFPKAIRLPSTTNKGRGQALYRAADVIAWTARYQDKN
ncbi:MAG: hypothetical protein Q8R69_05630 [Telluria sp.]|nr:hypothetical protein [Telluria sp.]